MATSEGYIMPNPSYTSGATGKYNYFYSLKDHLGNVRVVVGDDADASQVQVTDYTAFGVAISSDVSKNKYLYNGKELQDGTNWLDYGARMYQPEIGRWMAVDPMTENQESWSPFHYTYNNPVRFTDPDGREPCCGEDGKAESTLATVLSYTDVNDATVLVTFATRGGEAINIDVARLQQLISWPQP